MLRKILLTLTLLGVLLVPLGVTSPATAAGCGGAVTKNGDVLTFNPASNQTWKAQIKANGRTCTDQLNRIGWKTQSLNIRVWRSANPDNVQCARVGNPWVINPNIIGHNSAWNPGAKTKECVNFQAGSFDFNLHWDAPGDGVMAYAFDPSSDRCIGGIIDANEGTIVGDSQYVGDLKTLCVI